MDKTEVVLHELAQRLCFMNLLLLVLFWSNGVNAAIRAHDDILFGYYRGAVRQKLFKIVASWSGTLPPPCHYTPRIRLLKAVLFSLRLGWAWYRRAILYPNTQLHLFGAYLDT